MAEVHGVVYAARFTLMRSVCFHALLRSEREDGHVLPTLPSFDLVL